MQSIQAVHLALGRSRDELVRLAELAVNGAKTRNEVFDLAQSEHDVLVSLLEETRRSEHGEIHDLLLRYDYFMKSLVH